MSKAILLDANFEKSKELELPKSYAEINSHNLYLYVKSYLASLRANNAKAKTRGEVSGGGKKPWAQKGTGRARAGSITAPNFVGGGVSHGPNNNRNYNQKVNKKQKRLALLYALNEKGNLNQLFVVDKISVESGKTKDAAAILKKIGARSTLIVVNEMDEKTFLAFRNIPTCYLIQKNELNAYLVSSFWAVVIEKTVYESIINEG